MKRTYLSEREVESKIGNIFAKEKVSFDNWNILDIEIQTTGIDAIAILINPKLRREMKVFISTRCVPVFVTKGKISRKKEMFTSLREAIAS